MGVLGSLLDKFNAVNPESGLSFADRLGAAGGALSGDPNALTGLREMAIMRQQKAQQNAILNSLFGGGQSASPVTVEAPAPVQPSAGWQSVFGAGEAPQQMAPLQIPGVGRSTPKIPSLRNPITQQQLAALAASGYKIGDILELAKAGDQMNKVEVANGIAYNPYDAKPGDRIGVNLQNVNGFQVDTQDPTNAGRYIPKLEDGAVPLFDDRGNVVAQRLLDGTIGAISAKEGAKAGAIAAAQAPYDLQSVDSPNGGKIVGSRAQILGMGPLQSQTPVQAKAAETTFDAQTAFPQVAATAQQTLDLIGQLRTHPGRKAATGLSGVLPAIPGTATKDFTSLLDQAKGQTFLSAYNQLKGAGAITEMEGKKAEQAIARLDRTQSEEGFLNALNDLQGVIQAGMQRARAKAAGGARQAPSRAVPRVGTVQQGYIFKGGDPSSPSSWERVR